MFTLLSSLRDSNIDVPHRVPSRRFSSTLPDVRDAPRTRSALSRSDRLDPWDRVWASPFFATWIGRCVIVAWSVVGGALFGLASGAVLGTVAGGWATPLARDPSLLSTDVLLTAFLGALAGAVFGGQGSDPVAESVDEPET